MEIFVDGNKTDSEAITVNDGLNFSRFYNLHTSQIREYELHLTKSELISLIEDEYIRVRDEIKQDDLEFNDTSEFSQTGYCSLENLLRFEEEFVIIIHDYLARELYTRLFPPTNDSHFVINSTDSIELNNKEVIIMGRTIIKRNLQQ